MEQNMDAMYELEDAICNLKKTLDLHELVNRETDYNNPPVALQLDAYRRMRIITVVLHDRLFAEYHALYTAWNKLHTELIHNAEGK